MDHYAENALSGPPSVSLAPPSVLLAGEEDSNAARDESSLLLAIAAAGGTQNDTIGGSSSSVQLVEPLDFTVSESSVGRIHGSLLLDDSKTAEEDTVGDNYGGIAPDESTSGSTLGVLHRGAGANMAAEMEDSRSSFDSFKAPLAPSGPIPQEEDACQPPSASSNVVVAKSGGGVIAGATTVLPQEEDSQGSITSQRSTKRGRWEIAEIGDHRATGTLAENLFEYQWPPGSGGEYYMLQEQICEYLGIKSFKRKYPELFRRQVDMDEKEFLKENGVVSETMCDLGLTALRADEVIDLMVKDYFAKYQEYERVLQEKEKKSISEKHKGYSAPNIEKSKMAEFVKKSMRSAAEWNLNLNRERQEERKACFDLQSYTINYPMRTFKKLSPEQSKVGMFPVSLIPGQFQETYRIYSPVELKYLPVNTVLYGPRKPVFTADLISGSDASQSESEDSSCSEGSSSCSTRDGSSEGGAGVESSGGGGADGASAAATVTVVPAAPIPPVHPPIPAAVASPAAPKIKTPNIKKKKPYVKKTPALRLLKKRLPDTAAAAAPASTANVAVVDESLNMCRVCGQRQKVTREGKLDEIITCSLCKKFGHVTCLDMNSSVVSIVKTYEWQCMDCKKCMMCRDPFDEDKMMFCEKCDRGYHTFCVGLKNLPNGPWKCTTCSSSGKKGGGSNRATPEPSEQHLTIIKGPNQRLRFKMRMKRVK